jgi:hypothetical protein
MFVSALTFILRRWIAQQFEKDFADYKQRLEVDSRRDEIRFSRLHERQAEIIHELYKRVMHIRSMCYSLKTEHQDVQNVEDSRASMEIFEEMLKTIFFFGQNGLYFSTNTKNKFSELFAKGLPQPLLYVGAIDEIDTLKEFKPDWRKQLRDAVLPLLKEKLVEFDEFVSALEQEFQNLIGLS